MTQAQTNGSLLEQVGETRNGGELGKLLDKPSRGTIAIENGQLVPKDFEGVQRMAKWLMAAGIVPKWVQNEAQCTLALAYGMSAGLSALNSLRWVMVVNNAPAIWGDAAAAVVRKFKNCAGISERIDGNDENMVSHCEAKRWNVSPDGKAAMETCIRSFSVADAKKAGLWGKSGPWAQHPKRMLQMRARGFALRDLFPDVLGGMYLVEEVDEDGSSEKAASLDAKIAALSPADNWGTQTFVNPAPVVETVNTDTGEVIPTTSPDEGKKFTDSLIPQDEPGKSRKK